ncbi:MAG: hypothetical protein ABIH78_04595 [Candidatus Peregrinibacteria bacterium]
MSKIKPYILDQYSVFDITNFLKNKNYDVKFCKRGDIDEHYLKWKEKNNPNDYYVRKYASDILNVVGTDVYIDFPSIGGGGLLLPCIRFESYPKTENYEKSKKLYESLKRKFGVRGDKLVPKSIKDIKDLDKMKIIDWRKGGKRIPGDKLNNSKNWWKFWKM